MKQKLSKVSKMLEDFQLRNICQFDEDVTNYQFAENQTIEDKQNFISYFASIDPDEPEQVKGVKEYIRTWSEGVLNMVCSDESLIDEFREFIETEGLFRS